MLSKKIFLIGLILWDALLLHAAEVRRSSHLKAFNFASEATVCFGIIPASLPRYGGRRCRLGFFAQSALVILEFCPLHYALLATYGELYKRGRPLRKLQDQVGVVVFHLVDSLHLRVSHESPFLPLLLRTNSPLSRNRLYTPSFFTIAFANCLPDHACLNNGE